TTKALATDDSAWLQKGDTIVHVNGPSGRFDAVVADEPTALAGSVRDRLEIVQGPNSQVFAADPTTHKIFRIDLSTMAPQTLSAAGTDVLAAGSSHFVVNATKGTVTSFNPNTLALSQPVNVPGGVASDAITQSGVVYIGSNDGTVTVIDHGKATTTRVAPNGHPIEVSVVGNEPIAIDSTTGELRDLGSNGAPEQPVTLPGQPKATVQVAPSLAGNTAWLIHGTQLVEVNPNTGNSDRTMLPAPDTFGAPLANAGNGYVADDSTGQVLVYDSTLHVTQRVSVPTGLPGDTDVQIVVKDGNVWADNPTSSEATVIHPNGTTQIVNKGTGNGVYVPRPGHKQAQPRTGPAAGVDPGSPQAETNQPSPTGTTPQAGVNQPSSSDSQGASPPASQAPPLSPTAPFVPPTQTPAAPVVASPPVAPAVPPVATPAPVNLPVVANAPVTSHPTPPSPASTTTTTSPRSGSPTTVANVVVPKGLVGKSVAVACQAIVAAKLNCAQKDLGQAPAGKAPNVVTAVPEQGRTVPENASVEVDFYSTGAPITIPAFSKGESAQTYCSKIPSGLTCTPNDKGQGNPKGQVFQTEPAVGTTVAYGSTVLADYYSSSKPIFVPTPGAPEQNGGNVPTDPNGYCNYADTLGFNCTATPTAVEQDTDKVPGLADPSQPLNTVASSDVTPAPSSTVGLTYGTNLTVVYFNKQGIAVPGEDNQPQATAWTNYTSAGLTQGTATGTTVAGIAPGTVVPGSEQAVVGGNAVAAAGLVVASGTTINFDYALGSTVPNIAAGTDETTACGDVTAAGLVCSPNVTAGGFGTQAGVTSLNPGPGTVLATQSSVTVNINNPDPGYAVGSCLGAVVGAGGTSAPCQAGTNWVAPVMTTWADVGSDGSCNTITAQVLTANGAAVAPGTQEATGTQVTPEYVACSIPIVEYHYATGGLGSEFHYLAVEGGFVPGGYTTDGPSTTGGFVPFSDGSCPTGTDRLYQSSLA
ncbi:MAG: hypothetical protein FWC87_15490, partial [Acidimicrobiaceae bacterium]|nr:hypothetical protein [Acidimicrobiaceae bacterium]